MNTYSKEVFKGDGTPERGKRIIAVLEGMGGVNKHQYRGDTTGYYFINNFGCIVWDHIAPKDRTLANLEDYEKPVIPKPVEERDNLDLLKLVCELSGRCAMQPNNREMHEALWEARQELEDRINPVKLSTVEKPVGEKPLSGEDLFQLNTEQKKAFDKLKKAFKECTSVGILFYDNYGSLGALDKNKVKAYDDDLDDGAINDIGQNALNEFKLPYPESWADDAHFFHPNHKS